MAACANNELGVVDVNGDGTVAVAEAVTNCSTIATAYVGLHSVTGGMGTVATPGFDNVSPFNGNTSLFVPGAGAPLSGQIGVQQVGLNTIVLRGWDDASPTPIFVETISIE
jgi:hypothetical protein